MSIFLLFTSLSFATYSQIVINEIFADYSPKVGLPEAEFVELYNTTDQDISLENYKFQDASKSVTFPKGSKITANGYVLLCKSSAKTQFEQFGDVIGFSSFPALNNSGDDLSLINADGKRIDFVAYKSAWYQDAEKAKGGWSLERINPNNNCDGSANWKASQANSGGTPNQQNSVLDTAFYDDTPLQLISALLNTSQQLELQFSKKIDGENFESSLQFSPKLTILETKPNDSKTKFFITFEEDIQENSVFELTITNLNDCNKKTVLNTSTVFGKSKIPKQGDLLINEILFNPFKGGVDFVEIINTSNQILALDGLNILEINTQVPSKIDDDVIINGTNRWIKPNEFMVFTTKKDILLNQYNVQFPENIVEVSLPNYNDEQGHIALLNEQKDTLDQVHYSENWHFEAIRKKDGVSLERISSKQPSQDANNWFSSSFKNGYATPTAENSQKSQPVKPLNIQLSSEIFTPDHDGQNDVLFIQFPNETKGSLATVTVYNIRGFAVKTILNNELLGFENSVRWSGLDENNQPLPIGHYIIAIEVFDENGNTNRAKKKVTLSRRF